MSTTRTPILLAGAAAIALLAPPLAAADYTIKFSHVVAENTPKGQMAKKFEELAEARLPGVVDVEVYPNSQLYDDDASIPALLLGDIQLIAVSLSKFEQYTEQLQLFDLPFLFSDLEAVNRFQDSEPGQQLLRSMEGDGIVGLGYLHNGLKQLSANTPLRVPEDAAGLKFRIQASDVLAAQFETLDALPVKKPFGEVFTLLQTKAIDGQENTWSNIYSQKFFEVQDYISVSNHGVIDYLVATSADFWNGLPDDVRTELTAALEESIAFGNEEAVRIDQEARAAIEASGQSEIIELTPEERQQWVDAMRPVWAEFEDEIGKDLIAEAASYSTM